MSQPRKMTLSLVCTALLAVAMGCSDGKAPRRVELFNGKDLTGWYAMHSENQWQVVGDVALDPENRRHFTLTEGAGILVNGPRGQISDLVSSYEHGDCHARIEYLVTEHSNSGIYFQGRYEIQILDSYGKADDELRYGDNGGIYAFVGRDEPYPSNGYPPRVNASRAPGEWQSFDVVFRAPRFDAEGRKIENARFVKIVHNGQLIHENAEVYAPTRGPMKNNEVAVGPLRLQGDHGAVAFRTIWIEPLNLD